jgi:hypothetical protein
MRSTARTFSRFSTADHHVSLHWCSSNDREVHPTSARALVISRVLFTSGAAARCGVVESRGDMWFASADGGGTGVASQSANPCVNSLQQVLRPCTPVDHRLDSLIDLILVDEVRIAHRFSFLHSVDALSTPMYPIDFRTMAVPHCEVHNARWGFVVAMIQCELAPLSAQRCVGRSNGYHGQREFSACRPHTMQ